MTETNCQHIAFLLYHSHVLLCVLSIIAIILKRKRELVALILLSYGLVTVYSLFMFILFCWLKCFLPVSLLSCKILC